MKSAHYLDRLNNVLSDRFQTYREKNRTHYLGLRALGAGVMGAALCLVVLKGAAIAQGDVAVGALADAGWLGLVLGADPISMGVAQTFAQAGGHI